MLSKLSTVQFSKKQKKKQKCSKLIETCGIKVGNEDGRLKISFYMINIDKMAQSQRKLVCTSIEAVLVATKIFSEIRPIY